MFPQHFKHMASDNRPEDKVYHPQELKKIREHLWERIIERKQDVFGYTILFASETGLRVGEIPSLKWKNVFFL